MARAIHSVSFGRLLPRMARQSRSPLAPRTPTSSVSDSLWRVTHAVGELLAFLWGMGALSAVGMFVAGIFG